MKRITCFLLSIFFIFKTINAQQEQPRFGEASQRTINRLNEIDGELTAVTAIGGLYAVNGLIDRGVTRDDAAGQAVDVATRDEDDYRVLADFVNTHSDLDKALLRRAIDELLTNDELAGNSLLTPEERGFWTDYRDIVDHHRVVHGITIGEPHLTSFDGTTYDLQAVGEFVLCRSDKHGFEVQVRQSVFGNEVAANTSVAMNLYGQKISFYSKNFPDNNPEHILWVNKRPVSLRKKFLVLPKGGAIEKISNTQYVVLWETGEQVNLNFWQSYIDVDVALPSPYKGVKGLLGNANDNNADDFMNSNGKIVTRPGNWSAEAARFINLQQVNNDAVKAQKKFQEEVTRNFADSWRITDLHSLFLYPSGKNTASFTNKLFPTVFHSITDLDANQVAKAKNTCKAAGVADDKLDACIYDVAFTQQDIFATSHAYANNVQNMLNTMHIRKNIPQVQEPKAVQEVKQVKEKAKTKVKKLIGGF